MNKKPNPAASAQPTPEAADAIAGRQVTSDQRGPVPTIIPVEEEIEQVLGEIVPPQQLPEVTERVLALVHKEFYQGPIPPPKLFAQYEGVLPGAADRVLAMAEKRQAHEIAWETTAIKAESRNSTLGLVFGILALAILVGGALGALALGHPWIAAALVGTTALGLIPAFIKGRGLFGFFESAQQSQPEPEPEKPKPSAKQDKRGR